MVMVLLKKLNQFPHKLYLKLDHHHHEPDQSNSLSVSSQSFRTKLNSSLHQLFSDSSSVINGNLITIPLSSFPKFLNFFRTTSTAFSNLVSELDYPISKWEDVIVDEYLSYTLSLLQLLNSFSSALSHLRSSRMALVHAVSLVDASLCAAIKRLRPIIGGDGERRRRSCDGEVKGHVGGEMVVPGGKGKVVYESVKEMKNIGLWVYGVVLSGLTLEGGTKDVSLPDFEGNFGLSIGGEGGGVEVKEVKEVNEAVGELAGSLAMGKTGGVVLLKRKLEEFENGVDEVEKNVNSLFSEVLATRNQLLGCFRFNKN